MTEKQLTELLKETRKDEAVKLAVYLIRMLLPHTELYSKFVTCFGIQGIYHTLVLK